MGRHQNKTVRDASKVRLKVFVHAQSARSRMVDKDELSDLKTDKDSNLERLKHVNRLFGLAVAFERLSNDRVCRACSFTCVFKSVKYASGPDTS